MNYVHNGGTYVVQYQEEMVVDRAVPAQGTTRAWAGTSPTTASGSAARAPRLTPFA